MSTNDRKNDLKLMSQEEYRQYIKDHEAKTKAALDRIEAKRLAKENASDSHPKGGVSRNGMFGILHQPRAPEAFKASGKLPQPPQPPRRK